MAECLPLLLMQWMNMSTKICAIMGNRDSFKQIEHHSNRWHDWLGLWKDMSASDIKIFIAHLLIMSSVTKPALHNYWSTKSLSRTPFFGQYLSRNKFQDVLWNLHICDISLNLVPGLPNHDSLAKVRPFIQMCQDNFILRYTLNEFISLDELCIPFKDQVKFL